MSLAELYPINGPNPQKENPLKKKPADEKKGLELYIQKNHPSLELSTVTDFLPADSSEALETYKSDIEKGEQKLIQWRQRYDLSIGRDDASHKKQYNWLKRLLKKSLRKPQASARTKNIEEIINLYQTFQKKRLDIAEGLEVIMEQSQEESRLVTQKLKLRAELLKYKKGIEELEAWQKKVNLLVESLRTGNYEILSNLEGFNDPILEKILDNPEANEEIANQYERRLIGIKGQKDICLGMMEVKANEFTAVKELISDIVRKRKTLLQLYNPAIIDLKKLESLLRQVEQKSRSNEAIVGLKDILDDKGYAQLLQNKKERLDAEYETLQLEIETKLEVHRTFDDDDDYAEYIIDAKHPAASIDKLLSDDPNAIELSKTDEEKLGDLRKELEE